MTPLTGAGALLLLVFGTTLLTWRSVADAEPPMRWLGFVLMAALGLLLVLNVEP